jgi:hypothetical protein
MRYGTFHQNEGSKLKSTLQIEYCLVDLNPSTERATLLLDQEKVIRQWENSAASKTEP